MRVTRVLGVALLVLLGALGVFALAALVLGGLILPMGHFGMSSGSSTMATMTWAFRGAAFRPTTARADATGWRVASVLVSTSQTVVVAVAPIHQGATMPARPVVFLSDSSGHVYAQQPSANLPALLSPSAGQFYDVTAFGPLRVGTTALLVRHAIQGGGTTRVAVNLARLAGLPPPIHPNITRVAGRVRVTLVTVTRGALLSEVDLQARGFADPGGEVTKTYGHNTAMETQMPPQMPVTVTLRTAAGLDLSPQTGTDPLNKGTVTTPIGFTTPPRGTLLTLTVDDYTLDLPPRRGLTRGRWSFTFRMP